MVTHCIDEVVEMLVLKLRLEFILMLMLINAGSNGDTDNDSDADAFAGLKLVRFPNPLAQKQVRRGT